MTEYRAFDPNEKATRRRILTDAFVFVAHVVAVSAIYGSDKEFASERAGKLLLAMECVTIVFHLWYVLSLSGGKCLPDFMRVGARVGKANPYKWLEYAVSATIGGFAGAWVNGDPGISVQTQILLAGAGAAQQASGYQLEALRWPSNSKESTDKGERPGEIVSFARCAFRPRR